MPAPDTVDGIAQTPIQGTSMAYTWDKAGADLPPRTTQYFEMLGNRAIYDDGWVAATSLPRCRGAGWATPPDLITGYDSELYDVYGTDAVQRPGRPDAGQAQGTAGVVL